MSSPTSRSLDELRKRGYIASVVEKTIKIPGRTFKRDCFGFDVLAAKAGEPVLGVQACAGTDHAKRRLKVLANPDSRAWVTAGHALAVWSWSKRGERGKRKLWTLREDALTLADFPVPAVVDTSLASRKEVLQPQPAQEPGLRQAALF